jgi:hypothetical protein
MPKIVISYRRADSEAMAGRIHDCLVEYYGDTSVYRDVESIPPGKDFRLHINEAIHGADVLVVVVGPNWRGPKQGGGSRIKEATDPVRTELETAMERNIPVVPVLVDDAVMPRASDLPTNIRKFSYHNAAIVDAGRDFRVHIDRLIGQMDEILGRKSSIWIDSFGRRRWAAVIALGACLVLLATAWALSPMFRETSPVRSWHPPQNRGYFTVDKSTVYLEPTGDKRQFFYVDVSQEMLERDVLPGTLLFEGRIEGTGDSQRYVGKIFEYFGRCGSLPYHAEGPVLQPGPRIELIGKAPRVDNATCKKIDEDEKTLLFGFKERK